MLAVIARTRPILSPSQPKDESASRRAKKKEGRDNAHPGLNKLLDADTHSVRRVHLFERRPRNQWKDPHLHAIEHPPEKGGEHGENETFLGWLGFNVHEGRRRRRAKQPSRLCESPIRSFDRLNRNQSSPVAL
jgi:hypothetical protein